MKRYENISIWRSISCLGVLMFHILLQAYGNIFSFGKYGVLFFFIITGFLAFASGDIHENIFAYWRKRVIRIMPMYATVLTGWFILFSAEERSLRKGWEMITSDFIGGTWTVWVTMVFYVVAPLLVRVMNTYIRAAAMLLVFCIPRYLYIVYKYKCLDKTLQYMCFVCGGGVIYYAFKEEKERLTVFLLAAVIILMKLTGYRDDYAFYFFIFMIIFMTSRYIEIKGNICRKLIGTVDKYSYNIYLVHPIVLYILRNYNCYIQIAFGVLGSLGLGWLSYKWIDERISKRMTERRKICLQGGKDDSLNV